MRSRGSDKRGNEDTVTRGVWRSLSGRKQRSFGASMIYSGAPSEIPCAMPPHWCNWLMCMSTPCSDRMRGARSITVVRAMHAWTLGAAL